MSGEERDRCDGVSDGDRVRGDEQSELTGHKLTSGERIMGIPLGGIYGILIAGGEPIFVRPKF